MNSACSRSSRLAATAVGVVLLATGLHAGDSWSLRPLRRPDVPHVEHADRVINSIDAFILAKLEAQGIEPAPPADRETLIRRATLDVTGLPPSPKEVDAFAADTSPQAYERLVDSLLASPRYGERWARHWLDVARFAESNGFEYDHTRENAWRYRDYVIDTLNADKPYDQFVKEQIAGDVLEPVTRYGIIATGFLVAGPWDEAGSLQKSDVMRARAREEELEDMIAAVSQTFLGVTANCARCHDHKFDPVPQRDYYRLKAALSGVRHGNRPALGAEEMSQHDEALASLKSKLSSLRRQIAALDDAARARAAAARGRASPAGGPAPIARWTFDGDARDSIGGLDGTLAGGAKVVNGRLRLKGRGAFVATRPLERELTEKTLEAWVALASIDQRGGAPISVETPDGRVFDAIVFGEREPRKWVPGSSFFERTRDLAGIEESAKPGELVHVAVTYRRDGSIALYRNGEPYGEAYNPAATVAGAGASGSAAPASRLQTYKAGEARVLLGLRHTGAANGFFDGEIEEARLYDRALTKDEVRASFESSVASIPLAEALHAMTPDQRANRDALAAELERGEKLLETLAAVSETYAAIPKEPEPTYVLLRGDVEKRGEMVSAGGLSAVAAPSSELGLAPDAPEGLRRVKLAEWIASPENPFTARVIANRLWHYHFGRGIAATPNDLGVQGERPTHPELLDWLASELIAQRWSLKKLHRLILTSSTYRQSGRFSEKAASADADNRLLWRFAPRRLEGEAIRDTMLAVSGELNLNAGGPSFRPFTVTVFNSSLYTPTDLESPELNRRTIYRMGVQSAKDPLLESLDCPDPSVKAPARNVTTTPIQGLGLMNSSFVERQSHRFADRLRREAGGEPARQVEQAYFLSFSRRPTPDEADRAAALVREQDLESLCWALLNASEFLYLR